MGFKFSSIKSASILKRRKQDIREEGSEEVTFRIERLEAAVTRLSEILNTHMAMLKDLIEGQQDLEDIVDRIQSQISKRNTSEIDGSGTNTNGGLSDQPSLPNKEDQNDAAASTDSLDVEERIIYFLPGLDDSQKSEPNDQLVEAVSPDGGRLEKSPPAVLFVRH